MNKPFIKCLCLFLAVLFSSTTFSSNPSDEFDQGLWHEVVPDSFAKKGTIHIQTKDLAEDGKFFQARFKYDFNYKFLIFRRNLKGEEVVDMPMRFRTEQGFIDLERQGTFEDPRVTLIHRGRIDWAPLYDCHLIGLIPKTSKKWEGEFVYCPEVPKSGIAEMRLTVKKIPLLGDHTIVSLLRDRELL